MKRLWRLSIQRFGVIVGITGLGILSTTTSVFAWSSHKPPPSRPHPHVHTSAGIGGGTSGCKTSTVYVNPAFHWCARVTPSQPHKSSKPLPSGGTGRLRSLPKTPHSVSIGTSPKKSPASPTKTTTKTTPKKTSKPTVPSSFTTVSVIVPWTFNGCETNPAVTGTTQDPSRDLSDAPGEPSGTPIAIPNPYRLILPPAAPVYAMGQTMQYTPIANLQFWDSLSLEQQTGHILPGPGWGIQSEELQKLLHTPHLVTSKSGSSIAWAVSHDGPPYWVAREIYAVNSCPYPIATFTPVTN